MKTAVNVKLQLPQSSFINTDGDFDNGIVHMNSFNTIIWSKLQLFRQYRSNGEGWSDFALMLQIKAGDSGKASKKRGTFVSNQAIDGIGIRNYPYR
jgi:hypothetical protein